MGFGCPICSEQLHRLPAEATQQNAGVPQLMGEQDINISATPCGHLFHTYCINKWLSGTMLSSKQCPCCRKPVPGSRVLPLYPNGYDDSILDESTQESSGSCDHSNFTITIGSLRREVEILQGKTHEAETMLAIQTDVSKDFKKKYQNEKAMREQMTYQWKQYESYKDYSEEKERECHRLKSDLKKYQILDSMVKGSNDFVEEELQSYPPTTDTIHTLLEMMKVLRDELQTVSKKQAETKKDQDAVASERMKLHTKLSKLQKSYDELKRVYDNSHNTSMNQPLSEDRVYNVMHGNRTPLLMASKVTRKLVMNHEDEPIDEDVPLIQPSFAFKSKPKIAIKSKKASATVTSGSLESSSKTLVQKPEAKEKKIVKKASKSPEMELDATRKRKSEEGAQQTIKKIQKTLDVKNKPSQREEVASSSKSIPPANSKSTKTSQDKVNVLTRCLAPNLNSTIQISDSEDDDSPMQLKGSIPGMKITPQNRPNIKSAAGRALIKGILKRK